MPEQHSVVGPLRRLTLAEADRRKGMLGLLKIHAARHGRPLHGSSGMPNDTVSAIAERLEKRSQDAWFDVIEIDAATGEVLSVRESSRP
jgi:hypothetical protein